MKNIKIGVKLIGSFIFMSMIAITIGIGSATAVRMVNESVEDLAKGALPTLQAMSQLSESQNIVMSSLKGLANPLQTDAGQRKIELDAIAETWKNADAAVAAHDALDMHADEKVPWEQMMVKWNRWKKDALALYDLQAQREDLMKSGAASDDPRFTEIAVMSMDSLSAIAGSFTATSAALDELQESELTEAGKTEADAKGMVLTTRIVIAVIATAGAILALLLGILITRSIRNPITQALNASNRLAEGDLTGRITSSGRDETGLLLEAMGNMMEKLSPAALPRRHRAGNLRRGVFLLDRGDVRQYQAELGQCAYHGEDRPQVGGGRA